MTEPEIPPPPSTAVWSTVRADVLSKTYADGTFVLEAPLYDAAQLALTVRFEVNELREVKVLVSAEPGVTLAGFEAWSNV